MDLALQRIEYEGIGRRKDGIVVGALNKGGTGSMMGKRQEIETLLVTNKLDILGVFECEIKKGDKVKRLEIKGYKLIWDRGYLCEDRKTARTAVYVKEGIEFEVAKEMSKGAMVLPEVWINVGKGQNKILLGMVYREHKVSNSDEDNNKKHFQTKRWNDWIKQKKTLWTTKRKVIMMGDLNVDLIKSKGEDGYTEIRETIEDNLVSKGWNQLVTDFTRIARGATGITRTLIDHIWTNAPGAIKVNGLLGIPWSDHDMPWVELELNKPKIRPEVKKARCFRKFSIIELLAECKKISWEWGNYQDDAEPEVILGMKVCGCKTLSTGCCEGQKYETEVRKWKEKQRVGEINQVILDNRVEELEAKMRKVIEGCAPMRTTIKKRACRHG